MGDSEHQLDYAPRPRQRRTVMVRRAVLGGLLVFILVAGIKWGPVAWEHGKLIHLQDKCLAYRAEEREVAYGAEPGDVNANPPWAEFYAAFSPPFYRRDTVVFVGELRNRRGARLVGVQIVSTGFVQVQFPDKPVILLLDAEVIEPGRLFTRPRVLSGTTGPQSVMRIEADGPVKVFAGQRDPANGAHFTITFTSGKKTAMIDGWLTEDDRIVLETRK